MNVILQFRIKNAVPPVTLNGLSWFYSPNTTNISDPSIIELTNLPNRTTRSQLVSSFSNNGTLFSLTVMNIVLARREGDETDSGYYFLQATNPAGTSTAFINLTVFGKKLRLYMYVGHYTMLHAYIVVRHYIIHLGYIKLCITLAAMVYITFL